MKKYMVCINLSGIWGPITLSRKKGMNCDGWWDRTGDWGWWDSEKGYPRKDSDCYEFVGTKEQAKIFAEGARALANRLKGTL